MKLPENPTPEQFQKIAPLLIKEILGSGEYGYPNEIDDITWTVQNGAIVGQFASENEVYQYEIKNGRKSYGLTQQDSPDFAALVEQFRLTESPEFATAKGGGKRKVCKNGIPCGNSCIAKNKKCRSAGSAQDKQFEDYVKANAGGGKKVDLGEEIAKTEKGGELVAQGGRLAKSKGGQQDSSEEPRAESSGFKFAEDKFASANPTDSQVEKFAKEVVKQFEENPYEYITRIDDHRISDSSIEDQKENPKSFEDRKIEIGNAYASKLERTYKSNIQSSEKQLEELDAAEEALKTSRKSDAAKEKEQRKISKRRSEVQENIEFYKNKIEEWKKKSPEDRFMGAKGELDSRVESLRKMEGYNTLTDPVRKAAFIVSSFGGFEGTVSENKSNTGLNNTPAFNDTKKNLKASLKSYLQRIHSNPGTGGKLKTLGLSDMPKDIKELKAAYRKAATKSHPDQGGSREKFEAVNTAYRSLAKRMGVELMAADFNCFEFYLEKFRPL